MSAPWQDQAELAQKTLADQFWDEELGMFHTALPWEAEDRSLFHYWWMAHAAEALIDGWERTADPVYSHLLAGLYEGVLRKNGGEWPNNLYDDMEWMALAWLRAYRAVGDARYKEAALTLWADIQTGWNGEMGGGIAWQKTQLDYKNTPANAPAVILAARLYREFGRAEDLAWAKKIYDWQKRMLVDPANGFVWDGMNRQGDGQIDKDWRFTYCQGVFIGAGVELYRLTGESGYLEDAHRTAQVSLAELADPVSGLLPDEGNGDAGLFKGIYVRYLTELALESGGGQGAGGANGEASGKEETSGAGQRNYTAAVIRQARAALVSAGGGELPLFGTDWSRQPGATVELSSQLSGIILLEMAARLARAGQTEAVCPWEWPHLAQELQDTVHKRYMDAAGTGFMRQWYPVGSNRPDENFYYWWQAHVLDVLIDAYERSGDEALIVTAERYAASVKAWNGNTFLHNYYDDMEWMALALLRLYDHTGSAVWKNEVQALWTNIRTAWNDAYGGGMAWKKDQLDYKNTPANAPAAILAARLHQRFGDPNDLAWAKRIYRWNREVLVDPADGFVWDGINRQGDGRIDKDWQFTYCQGVFLGAGLELYRCTGDGVYLEDARRTAEAAKRRLTDRETGLLPDEGIDDTGLFKGILVRYLTELLLLPEASGSPELAEWLALLEANGKALTALGIAADSGLAGPGWSKPSAGPVQLSVQLSAIMLLEALARLARSGEGE